MVLGPFGSAGNRSRGRGLGRATVWRGSLLVLVLVVMGVSAAQTYVELILDASGSMYNRLGDGRYRIEAAKQVLVDLISGLPASDDLHVGLRVYGTRLQATAEGACEDSHLEVPIAGVDRSALRTVVEATLARGATPIALSLQLAARDFPTAGTRRVVLVTDGLESCGGDLEEVAQLYAELGIDLRIVGFDLSAGAASASLQAPAQVAAGTLFEVHWQGPAGQGDAVVLGSPGTQVALGTNSVRRIFSSPLIMPAPAAPGEYELRYLAGSGGQVLHRLPLTVG